jgi:hypothetical protein
METSEVAKVLWNGPLFGRLTAAGRTYLLHHGFQELSDPLLVAAAAGAGTPQQKQRLEFVWPNKSGPQFDVNDAAAARVRPYPTAVTEVLDDKILLAAELLKDDSPIMPPFITHPDQATEDKRYFVKHRWGVKGKSVYCYDKAGLLQWWSRSKNRRYFLIQQEVPPTLWENRKFVLRSHLLLLHTTIDSATPTFHAYLHKDVIYQQHASEYTSGAKSADVSQAGKKHPRPILLQNLPSDHPASTAFDKIVAVSRDLAEKFQSTVATDNMASDTACFALAGTDLLMDGATGNMLLCEVNSHPALGWGTMSQVDPAVFRGLIEDALSLVVLEKRPESFVKL